MKVSIWRSRDTRYSFAFWDRIRHRDGRVIRQIRWGRFILSFTCLRKPPVEGDMLDQSKEDAGPTSDDGGVSYEETDKTDKTVLSDFKKASVEGGSEVVTQPRVEFWARKTGNWWLSNFYRASIQWDNVDWPTSEHLYQALKLPENDREAIRLMHRPGDAKKMVHEIGYELSIQDRAHLMRLVIREKFRQHSDLADKLIATRGMIVEASPKDNIWGEGSDGKGLNLMGMLLMELRENLRMEKETPVEGGSDVR